MGYGSYQASDWAKLKKSRGINQSSDAGSLFSKNRSNEKYDPQFINMRESCDSADSPNSTPIIIGFDVTGSMGYLAAEIAKNSLNKTITRLYEKQPVTNPHVMCAAFTSPPCEDPLQVTQFEADIRVIEQLLELRVGFGFNRYAYDSLVWYFAARHTKIDSFEKRGKKGFLIGIGDEICGSKEGDGLDENGIRQIFGDEPDQQTHSRKEPAFYSMDRLLEMASEKYEVFHIVTPMYGGDAFRTWNEFMPGRVALLEPDHIDCLSEVITSLMQIAGGMNKTQVIRQWPENVQPVVSRAVESINPALFGGHAT